MEPITEPTPKGITSTTRRIVAGLLGLIVISVVITIGVLAYVEAPQTSEVTTALGVVASSAVTGLVAVFTGVRDGN
jgi:hypothetical protein